MTGKEWLFSLTDNQLAIEINHICNLCAHGDMSEYCDKVCEDAIAQALQEDVGDLKPLERWIVNT